MTLRSALISMPLLAAMAAGAFTAASTGAFAAETPAKTLFSARPGPSAQAPGSFGSYAAGCMAGAAQIPETGEGWQTMRPSRNRAWGREDAAAFIARLGAQAPGLGWPGLLIGDVSQPRGGPMRSGHRSHQIGLDIDIWLTPAPERRLSRAEREGMGAVSMVAGDRKGMSAAWTPAHAAVLQAAAEDPAVARIFVNAAIKAELCRMDPEAPWLNRIRPWWGHDAHFHVRLACPAGEEACIPQAPPPPGPGCDATLEWWFSDEALNPRPTPGAKPRGPLAMADLPAQCRAVLEAPAR